MKRALFCAAAIVIWGAATAHAQVVVDQAATAGESYARGMSGIISAQGQKNLDDSQARINNQDAYSAAIDNSVKSVNAFWEKKSVYQEHVDAVNAQTQAERERYIARRGSLDLSSEEFDRTTGAIAWPKILEQKIYDPFRTTLDQLFHDRSYNGALTGDQYMQASTAFADWRTAIMGQKDQFPQPILQQMLRFLNKVKRELDDNLS
jgi:hypothetical protein